MATQGTPVLLRSSSLSEVLNSSCGPEDTIPHAKTASLVGKWSFYWWVHPHQNAGLLAAHDGVKRVKRLNSVFCLPMTTPSVTGGEGRRNMELREDSCSSLHSRVSYHSFSALLVSYPANTLDISCTWRVRCRKYMLPNCLLCRL